MYKNSLYFFYMKRPICKSESDLFYRYIYFTFTPKLTTTVKNFDSVPMSGSILLETSGMFRGKSFNIVYCSPMWDGNTEKIEFEFHNGEDGFINRAEIDFPLNGWTMDVNRDVERFTSVVWNFLKNNTDKI